MNSREVARKIVDDLVASLLERHMISLIDLPNEVVLKWLSITQEWVEHYKP